MRIGLIFSLLVAMPLHADTLDGALNRLDQAGNRFKGMTAQITQLKYTALVAEKSTSTGEAKFKRPQPGEMLALFVFTSPDEKTIAINPKVIDIYLPKMKTVQEIDLTKHKGAVEQFFLFGFGTSRRDLEAAYTVSFGGPEPINGEAATRLVLVSRNPDVAKQYFSKFELWISDKTGEPLQQKFYEPSGDYSVFTYSDMKINPPLKDSDLGLPKLPKGVKKETLNK